MIKKYLNIREVSKIVGLKEHIIRYWDSIDPKTNRLRVEGISTKTRAGTRYFNKENLNKLQELKDLVYENGDHKPTLKLADKFLSQKRMNKSTNQNINKTPNFNDSIVNYKKLEKISQILKKLRQLSD